MVFTFGHMPLSESRYEDLAVSQPITSTSTTPRGRRFRRFGWSRMNSAFQQVHNGELTMGGGDGFALWLDAELRAGSSAPSSTYGNSCLSGSSTFQVANCELFGLDFDVATDLAANLQYRRGNSSSRSA